MKESINQKNTSSSPRREFLQAIAAVLGATALYAMPRESAASGNSFFKPVNKLTIQQVINLIMEKIPGAPFNETVDTIKTGDAHQLVKGIATTMFATVDVIRQAAAVGANLIIAHEPTFYNHRDETSWLENDPVFKFKNNLLKKHNIVVWRFHDYWHMHKPDGIQIGVMTKLGWKNYFNPENPRMVEIPVVTLSNLISHVKKSLGIRQVRFIGDLKQECKHIALLPGAAGGRSQIQLLQKERSDVLIVGEVSEWETSEYIRDAQAMKLSTSLIVLGHAESEEPGMEWLVSWLRPKIPDVNVKHIPSYYPFREA